jgi:hypothetical protein
MVCAHSVKKWRRIDELDGVLEAESLFGGSIDKMGDLVRGYRKYTLILYKRTQAERTPQAVIESRVT